MIHYIHCKYSKLLMTLKRAYLGMKGFWEDGVVGSTRNPAFHPDTVTLAEFVWYNYFGTLQFTEDLILPGEGLGIKLWLISVNFITFQLLIPTPKPNVRPLCTCSWSSYTQLARARVTIRTLSSKYQESVFWLLVAASDHRGTNRK